MKNNEKNISTLEGKQKKNKEKKKDRKHNHYSSEKKNDKYFINSLSESNNSLINKNRLEKSLTSDINSIDEDYQKDLYNKFMKFLNNKKFKISNKYDAKNAKKFLDTKNKCLERMILSDIIENTTDDFKSKNSFARYSNNDYDSKSFLSNMNKRFRTEKSVNKYFIIITNYDEELKSKNYENF
jgi:hypothetical protein